MTANKHSESATLPISVVLLVMDESDRVKAALDSVVGWVSEIVVLDSGSSDDTVDICKRYTGKVIETDWPGEGIQRQRSIEASTQPWILWIDADERVSPGLLLELRRLFSKAVDPTVSGYSIPWLTFYFGKWCRHGGLGDRHVRLFRREAASFDRSALVHPKVILSPNRTADLTAHLEHFSFRHYPHLLNKNIDYSIKWAAQRRNKKQSSLMAASGHAVWRFFQVLIVNQGFRDGPQGFLNAVMASQYVFNKYAGLWATIREESRRDV